MKILLVDDDPDQLFMFKTLIEHTEGFTVETISDPSKAIDRIVEGGIDAVVCDIMMPKINGKELVSRVQSINPKIKCILLTAAAFEPMEGVTIIPKSNAKRLLKKELLQGK